MRPVDLVLERAANHRKNGSGWLVSCPSPDHGKGSGDANPSVALDEAADGTVLIDCKAACDTEAVVSGWGLRMRDLFPDNERGGGGSYAPSKNGSTDQRSDGHGEEPATLENYAAYVGLPVGFLEGLSLEQYYRLGKPAVRMPYLDEAGEEVLLVRSRVSLTGKPKILTRKGDKHRLYGLWKLEEAREAGYAVLVEGESDCQTCWFHGVPAVGIPGANGWKVEWATELQGIDRLYFVVEDEAGEACWEKLCASPEIRERLHRVELEGAKDVSELHKRDPGRFGDRLREALETAAAWEELAASEEWERAREAWNECHELAESPDILSEFSRDLEACRVVGERANGELLYLALVSRLLEKIVSVAVKGPSSGGKSYLVKQVMSFFPDDSFVSLTAMGEKALLYTERDLRNKMLVLMEAAGLSGDFQEYVIRTLLSEGFLEYEVTKKTQDGLENVVIRKEGPTGFITTTTRDRLNAENETRYLSITVTDTREQTRRIFRALADGNTEGPDRGRWHALQAWLEGAERRVTIPYAGALAEKMGDVAVRLRRDFSVVLSLVKAHAILHQANRGRDAEGRIVATLADYSRVRGLVSGLIAEGVEATVPKTVRETVVAVESVIDGWEEDHATNKAVAEELEIDKSAASRRVRSAIGRGYVKNLEDRKGHPARLVIGEDMPEDREILPAAEELEGVGGSGCAVDPFSEGIEHPPPPSQRPNKGPVAGVDGGGGSFTPEETASTAQPLEDREVFSI
ncbi:MAG: hypothetical protein WKF67_13650 [Rubrobacteraceae bacterium]